MAVTTSNSQFQAGRRSKLGSGHAPPQALHFIGWTVLLRLLPLCHMQHASALPATETTIAAQTAHDTTETEATPLPLQATTPPPCEEPSVAQFRLWRAVRADDGPEVERAVRCGADVEALDLYGMTPLTLAAKDCQEAALRLLLRLGAYVERKDGWRGLHPLQWAAHYGGDRCVTILLLEGGARPGGVTKKEAQDMLWEGVEEDDRLKIERAFLLGVDLETKDCQQMTALGLAAKEGRERAVSTLLRLGAEVEAAAGEWGWSPLLWALANRQNQTEALLRKAGAQPQKVARAEAQDLLWKGVEEDDRLKIERAVLSGADLEEERDLTPLMNASYKGKVEAVRALTRLGARLERKGGKGQLTALHIASGGGHETVARVLLKAGADVMAKTKYRLTPLHYASMMGHLPVVRLLVEAGADINYRDRSGMTPLFYARSRRLTVAEYLRSVGATT